MFCVLLNHSFGGLYTDNMGDNLNQKLYFYGTMRQVLEHKAEDFVKSISQLDKHKAIKDSRVLRLTEKVRMLLAELQVMDNHIKVVLKSPVTSQTFLEELLALRKCEAKYYSYCSEYNEVLQLLLCERNLA